MYFKAIRTAARAIQVQPKVCAAIILLIFSTVSHGVKEGESPAAPLFADADGRWSFNVKLYMWLPGVNGDYSAGPVDLSVDSNFIDIVDASHRFPLGFMGRGEAYYERFGLYIDGIWSDLDLKPKAGSRGFASIALETEMGILDYGLTYRVLGPRDLANWQDEGVGESFRLDFYAGGRTIWLENTLSPRHLPSVTASKSFTSPVIGGRILIDFGLNWFARIDGNVGGFGAD